jgi:hypothetical protein
METLEVIQNSYVHVRRRNAATLVDRGDKL